jgi:EAL domain-containing protein (putative c-di-GMP-specific phosphodiesterase class I)
MELIEAQVFARAIEEFETWRANGMEVPRLSINVSNKRPLEPDFIEILIGAKKSRY